MSSWRVQMESDMKLPDSIPAEGPEGLKAVLTSLFQKTHLDPEAPGSYYILYRLGGQKSLIKVDMQQTPCQFWYYDLLGRPATQLVKETVNQFLLDKYGEPAERDE